MIKAIIFDFGGVIAEEGFKEGLKAIATSQGLDPERFFSIARELIYATGYVTGKVDEHVYWDAVRNQTGIKGTDEALRQEILKRFVVRPAMIEEAVRLRSTGLVVAVLSDQTDWLDRLDEKEHFSRCFDYFFNSFHLGKSKTEPDLFPEISAKLGVLPEEIVFIDDDRGHVTRAASQGWNTIHFKNFDYYRQEIEKVLRDE